jgi:predicted HicB family RNase H-like nuclease
MDGAIKHLYKGVKEKHRWPTRSIRANPEILHHARIAAVTQKKTLGQWLEEAIVEKIEREQGKDS